MMTDLVSKYKYSANYIPDYGKFIESVMNKTVIPYQIEMQPGPAKNLCWLRCPYCYGRSAEDTGERMSGKRSLEVLREAADGGVKKVIFAGFCTDPLNSPYIEGLLETAISKKMVFGFNTKALKVSNGLFDLLSSEVAPGSYVNISVDAGSNEVYNKVHGVSGDPQIYDRVLQNARHLWGWYDMSATYLIMGENNSESEIRKFVDDFAPVCDVIRFAFPQPPRGTPVNAPSCDLYLRPLIEELDSKVCRVILIEPEQEPKERTLPCLARWVYPTVGFDGWLYHCSQSAAPNFRLMALGDLNKRGFWEVFYDYNSMTEDEKKMSELGCRCDRKEHLTNSKGGK
jgi:MoaA/NifB/PqqE/SkfB family radical SAM enzyme